MKIYFLSSRPCALTLNGVFYGVTDSFERSAEICLSDKIYAKFSPQNGLPLGFFITEELTSAPPEGCEVYLLRDGIAIYACEFPPSDFCLHPIAQAREGEILATVFRQGVLQLNIESPSGFFNAPLPPCFEPCEVFIHNDFVLLKGEERLGVFSLTCKRLLVERVTEYSLDGNTLSAALPLSDRLQRSAKCKWLLDGETCKQTEFTLLQPTADGEIPDDLLAYAFFEQALLGGDIREFLSEALQPDADSIRAFLGDFIAVTLTPEPTLCGLVRRKADRLFSVDYFAVEIKEGKITDVKG